MKQLIQYSKIVGLSLIISFLLTACNKNELPVEKSAVLCDNVTVNVTNSLDEDIIDMLVNGEEVGTIKAGETIQAICLSEIPVDMGGSYPMIQITGEYENVLIGEKYGYCGVGIVIQNTGEFDIEINDVTEYAFLYINQ